MVTGCKVITELGKYHQKCPSCEQPRKVFQERRHVVIAEEDILEHTPEIFTAFQ